MVSPYRSSRRIWPDFVGSGDRAAQTVSRESRASASYVCDHTTPTAVGLMRDPDGFTAFANAQSRSLFGTAWLPTGDWHASDDLVQEALGRMYRYWHRIDRIENPAAYAHTVLVRVFLSQRRRRSSTERPARELPDAAEREPDHALRITLADAL